MALIKKVRGFTPVMGKNCFLAENATIVGEVEMGDDCTVWFNAVIRGDVHYIKMGNKVNVQDCAVIHGTYQKAATNIGNNVSIAHGAVVHGCTIHDNVLVGMRAIIMDNAVIHSNTIIAAGSVVLENTITEPNSIYGGIPAKKIKDIDPALVSGQIERIANSYLMYASWYKE
ncbi:MAG: gamma carbonic anhydrase family protein [Bacteroidetes bacterium HGW-Bacteroidetes-21]|jgi:carbonic anhydrase/acetyltransferase-like protein (isoleucine patch superfamily)|nr:MAG: gamma carbonic anhydrase family protein [Bacteroidetes bacterium HGW-Bacteroidetes-21]